MNETLTHSRPEWRGSISAAVLQQLWQGRIHPCSCAACSFVYKCFQQPPPIPLEPRMSGSSFRLLPLRRRPAVTKQLFQAGDFRGSDCGSREGRQGKFTRSISTLMENSARALCVGRLSLEHASLGWLRCTVARCRCWRTAGQPHARQCTFWPSYAVWAVGDWRIVLFFVIVQEVQEHFENYLHFISVFWCQCSMPSGVTPHRVSVMTGCFQMD